MNLRKIVQRLRSQCPWDRKQTLSSIKHLYVEEAYELAEALEKGDGQRIEEELGDLLYIVLMGIEIAREAGLTDYDKVEESASQKLIRRHPHVFGETKVSGDAEVLANWEKIKEAEKGGGEGFFEGIPKNLSALIRAQMMQERAARVGFDWPQPSSEFASKPSCSTSEETPAVSAQEGGSEACAQPPLVATSAYGPLAKIHEEAREFAEHLESGNKQGLEHELGDLLFSVVNLARHIGVRAEEALSRSNRKFQRRFEAVRKLAKDRNIDLNKVGIEELDKLWDEVKKSPQDSS
jgi:MazG family protein